MISMGRTSARAYQKKLGHRNALLFLIASTRKNNLLVSNGICHWQLLFDYFCKMLTDLKIKDCRVEKRSQKVLISQRLNECDDFMV